MCDGRGIIDREVCERCRGTGSATVDSIPLVDDLALASVAPTSPAVSSAYACSTKHLEQSETV